MHISEGILSMPVILGGMTLGAIGVAIGLRKINTDNLPKIAVLTAAFFTASFIHVNIGPGSVHLMLSGLIGLMLGWVAFPVVLIGLLIQGLLFQYGGLTTLGVNTFNIAGPAVFFGFIFNKLIFSENSFKISLGAFLTGFLSIALSTLMVALALTLTDSKYKIAAYAIFYSHIPVMIIEGAVALLCVRFLKKVKPELLRNPLIRGESGAGVDSNGR